jgi:chromosome segregation protein
MLKALELVGFKSFADRTRFDFPDGITVVVGPNGSGKSNVVDAVKWVLGAQSAKALRGADMADVIFKGSAEGGRKPANSAEVVLILDNSTRVFSHDADEVHVSRRVLRNGEGEYAINNQPCRLKDVKDLFRGTGVGVDAYSLIEQGKVDRLLQASSKDRRGIFEEAAGISRFKAKKVEAERRLARVDQNMLRLRDIVDELSNRLTTLKNQAAKANRYRELTIAIQTKRQQLGWIDRCALEQDQAALKAQLSEIQGEEKKLLEQLELQGEKVVTEQQRWDALQEEQESCQARYLALQRELVAAESGQTTSRQRSEELASEKAVLLERIAILEKRVSLSSEEIEQKQLELQAIDSECQRVQEQLVAQESELQLAQANLLATKQELEQAKADLESHRHAIAASRAQITAHELHIEQLRESIEQHRATLAVTQNEWAEIENEIATAHQNFEAAKSAAHATLQAKQDAEDRLQRHRLALLSAQEMLIAIQGKSHGVRERLLVLEQLEDQFTGTGRGGQQLLRLAKENRNANANPFAPNSLLEQHHRDQPPTTIASNVWDTVLGLVADLLTTEMHLAPLIDVALGTHADAIVLSNGQIIDWINDGNYTIDGRVTLIRMDRLTSRRSGEKIQLDGLRGVLGRADRMTRFDVAYEPLIRFLLGTTWFVDTLSTALELSHFRGAGLRFVTAECQLVESDGSITLGSLHAGPGLISRRSEMQSAREEIKQLEHRISEGVALVANAQAHIVESEAWQKAKDQEAYDATRHATACELRLESIAQRKAKLQQALANHEANLATAMTRLQETEAQLHQIRDDSQREELVVSDSEYRVAQLESQHTESGVVAQRHQAIVTERRIELARVEQRMVGLRTTMEQMQQDSDERAKNVAQAVQNLHSIEAKIESNNHSLEELAAKAASAHQSLEQLNHVRSDIASRIQVQYASLQSANRGYDGAERALEKGRERIESLQQQLQQLQTQWEVLHDLYTREFQLDLNELAEYASRLQTAKTLPDASHADLESEHPTTLKWLRDWLLVSQSSQSLPLDRSAIESELASLRQEVAAAGGVNMEALTELDELQARFDRLSNHHRDLEDAKATLIQTMTKIDEDSREMFVSTLASIRHNFQDLYRRSFGGGFADIVLENENDPDSGIEIIATPPGKTTLNNALLSGGEKALTAVALIMAFFQHRPSPFCILDEVDAPFDEANIGRFVTVLREFLDSTKFIVVTHSKKTMTAANMIYGITMQESGVSRQVSVRFEEVDDRGEIHPQKRAA